MSWGTLSGTGFAAGFPSGSLIVVSIEVLISVFLHGSFPIVAFGTFSPRMEEPLDPSGGFQELELGIDFGGVGRCTFVHNHVKTLLLLLYCLYINVCW
jgi:hypothetical protein